jgi:hypothetical protein
MLLSMQRKDQVPFPITVSCSKFSLEPDPRQVFVAVILSAYDHPRARFSLQDLVRDLTRGNQSCFLAVGLRGEFF